MHADMQRSRVVIVGGGLAGLAAARGLRSAAVDVSLVDRSDHPLCRLALSTLNFETVPAR